MTSELTISFIEVDETICDFTCDGRSIMSIDSPIVSVEENSHRPSVPSIGAKTLVGARDFVDSPMRRNVVCVSESSSRRLRRTPLSPLVFYANPPAGANA